MQITIDIEKELGQAIDSRQSVVGEINKLELERQGIIAQALKPVEPKLKQIVATKQKLLQEALRLDGEVRRLQSMKDKAMRPKKKPK